MDLNRELGSDLIAELDTSDADYGVTDGPTCRLQMTHFSCLPMRHPAEIVAAGLID